MRQEKTLLTLNQNTPAVIRDIIGGQCMIDRLCTMGIRKGRHIKVCSRQPFHGPLTVEVAGCHLTIGRNMANHIVVEESDGKDSVDGQPECGQERCVLPPHGRRCHRGKLSRHHR